MVRKFLTWIGACCLVLLVACASIGTLPGGKIDEKPPGVRWDVSTPNLQTKFIKQPIELYFDEWVKLNKPGQTIVISPPLEYKPEITLLGKKVRIAFAEDEVLKPDVTTIINFGDAVQDFTENNAAQDLQFVFSTGDQIDSLTCEGQVVDVLGQPIQEMWVGLYSNFADSAFYKEKPLYLDKTDSSGYFELSYLSEGEYRIVALKDEDFSLTYKDNELFGFLDTTIRIPANNIQLTASLKPQKPIFKAARQVYEGVQVFHFPKTEIGTSWQILGDTASIYSRYNRDSLFLYHPDIDSFEILLDKPIIEYKDTILVKNGRRVVSDSTFKLILTKPSKLVEGDNIVISANYPLQGFDTSRILLKDTALLDLNQYLVSLDSSGFSIEISGDFNPSSRYTLELLPGALAPIRQIEDIDTTSFTIGFMGKKNLGIIDLTIEGMQPDKTYGLIVQTKKDEIIRHSLTAETNEFLFENLLPSNYELLIFEDTNSNGVADTGDYLKKRQPEKIFIKKLDALRANWTLEVLFDITK